MASFVRPPLKWAGGKFRLLERILPQLPPGARLVEPFTGSGAVFLNAGYASFRLCDSNRDLIAFFENLAKEGPDFIAACEAYFSPASNTPEVFYVLRQRFNELDAGPERAALFLYLNRHAFNGLMRYNAKGLFNTPFGRYPKPYFPRTELEAMSRKLQQARVTFAAQDFRQTFAELGEGDVVYCDPPYVALSETANFTAYTAGAFGPAEQQALAECALAAARDGIPVILSNHDTPLTRSLYAQARTMSFPVQRFISCDGTNRAKAQELLAVFS